MARPGRVAFSLPTGQEAQARGSGVTARSPWECVLGPWGPLGRQPLAPAPWALGLAQGAQEGEAGVGGGRAAEGGAFVQKLNSRWEAWEAMSPRVHPWVRVCVVGVCPGV